MIFFFVSLKMSIVFFISAQNLIKFVPFFNRFHISLFTNNLPYQYNYNICLQANTHIFLLVSLLLLVSVYVQSNQVELIVAHIYPSTDKKKKRGRRRTRRKKLAKQQKSRTTKIKEIKSLTCML